jgi:hypothetical protein
VIKHRWTLIAVAAIVGVLCAACQKELVGNSGEPLQEKGAPVTVTLEGYALQRVEVEGKAGPLVYDKPVLVMNLKFENTGAAPFFYQPTHAADKASNQQSPLLFVNPGPKGELTQNIPGVFLEEGLMEGQQAAGVQIAPGAALTDRYLFSPPDQDNLEMALTIPPALHGGKKPIRVNISYARPTLAPPTIHQQGQPVTLGDATLTVKDAKVEFVRLKDSSSNNEGFSKDPVLKITYSIENKSAADLLYDPNHKGAGELLAPSLVEADGAGRYMRVRFGADRDAVGQHSGNQLKIAPGKSIDDFALFERPPEGIQKVRLLLPGRLFGQTGLARVDVPYTYSDPKKPAELTPKPAPE